MSPTSEPTDRSMLRETITRTMPVAMIAMPDGLDRHRDHVGRRDELAAADDVERDQDDDEGDEHPEQPEIDLRLRDQLTERRPRRRLAPDRIPVSHLRRSSRRPSSSSG